MKWAIFNGYNHLNSYHFWSFWKWYGRCWCRILFTLHVFICEHSLNSEILWIQRFSEFRDSLISEILWLYIFHGKCFEIHKKCCTQIGLLFEKQTFDTSCFGSKPSVVTANHNIAKLICNTEPFPLKRSFGIEGLNIFSVLLYNLHGLDSSWICFL